MKKIAIIGSGYVGLVSGAGLSEFGNIVCCLDIDKSKIDQLKNGDIPIYEPGLRRLINKNIQKGMLSFSSKISEKIKSAEIIFIAVGTPQSEDGSANLSYVESVANTIGKNLNNYKIVCTKSTVPVGTGSKIEQLIGDVSKSDDFDYVSNPEFLREGAAIDDFIHPDRIIVGAKTNKAFEVMKDVYSPLYINETPMIFTNVETAEMIKYASNAFLATKISFINEIANLCEKLGADVHQVSKGMGLDGRISSKFLHPGPGFGGSCFPKDTEALAYLGRQNNVQLNLINATIKTNINQKLRMFSKVKSILNNDLKGKIISILGLSFKPETDDIRESPASEMIPNLIKSGSIIHAYDPVAIQNFKEAFPGLHYFKTWRECVKGSDLCVILTEWNEFRGIDLKELKKLLKTPYLVDAKNIFSINKLKSEKFIFENVGRKI